MFTHFKVIGILYIKDLSQLFFFLNFYFLKNRNGFYFFKLRAARMEF